MQDKNGDRSGQKPRIWERNFFVLILAWLFVAFPAPAQSQWKAEWDTTVKAAEKESRVALVHGGGASNAMQRMFKEEFTKAYPGIQVDFIVGGGRSIAPRILAERGAGRYAWDIYIGGTTTALLLLKPAGAFDPVGPALIVPDVTDSKKWFGGQIDYADTDKKYNLAFGGYVIPPFAFNTQTIKQDAIGSFWDLLDPKWRGKIVMFDPRTPGAGLASATFAYMQPSLGKEFLRRLLTEQNVALVRDYRQVLEEVARGNYLVGIGVHQAIFNELVSKGLPLGRFAAENLKEGSYLTTATASLGLMNRGPHPNAAKVFLNWFLGKDAQHKYSVASGYWSRRLDVPRDHLDPGIVPKAEKYDSYQANYKEIYVDRRDEIVAFLRTLIKR